MKNKLLICTTLLMLIVSQNQVMAKFQSYSDNSYKIKNLVQKYINIELGFQDGNKQAVFQQMVNLGLQSFNTHIYTPCPNRGIIQIGGKSVNAKNRKCIEIKYTYNNKPQIMGQCGQPVR